MKFILMASTIGLAGCCGCELPSPILTPTNWNNDAPSVEPPVVVPPVVTPPVVTPPVPPTCTHRHTPAHAHGPEGDHKPRGKSC